MGSLMNSQDKMLVVCCGSKYYEK